MRFVQNRQIPGNQADFFFHPAGVMVRNDNDFILTERRPGFRQFPIRFGVDDNRREIELLFQLALPLLSQRRRTDDQQPPFPFRPELTQDQPRLDGFAQPHLVCQQDALRQRRMKREQRRLNLMRVQVNRGVVQRLAYSPDALPASFRQIVSKVLCVV